MGGGSAIRVNGVSLHVEERGAGPALLCIHGAGGSAVFWTDAAEELARLGRAIVYDRRGSFRSERPDPYVTDVHEHADDAAALLEALDAVPAVVIGRSYGGAVAIDLALRYPDRVRALVLLEGDGGLNLSPTASRELAELSEQVFAVAERDPGAVGEALFRIVAGDEGWEGLPAAAQEVLAANGPAIVAELRGGYPEVTVEELRTIAQPALLLAARESRFDYAEVTERVAAALPAARVEWIGGGHLIDPAHPAVLAFVAEVLAGD